MKVRSITCFYHPASPEPEKTLDQLAAMAETATRRFAEIGFEVQTTRLATPPFPQYVHPLTKDNLIRKAVELEASAAQRGFQYLSMGPAMIEFSDSYSLVPAALEATRNVFFSGVVATRAAGISLQAARACGEIIAAAATIEPNGFANLRFGAISNVPPNSPFLPASYHEGSSPAFALAIECGDAANQAFTNAISLADARLRLLDSLDAAAEKMTKIAKEMERQYGVAFKGLDMSPAPFPDDCCSLGGAIENLGNSKAGLVGMLSAAAYLADTLDQGHWQKTGFNGLMLPVLEDSILARRADEGTLELKDLLMYSAVCGAGLDTVPLPGSATAGQLASVVLDVAALAMRLNKPLIARLMPIPGKAAGDKTEFNFDYFAPGRILTLPAVELGGIMAGNEFLQISPRRS